MRIGIVSGYFQRFHEGHKEYIKAAIRDGIDQLVIIVQGNAQQRRKYRKYLPYVRQTHKITPELLRFIAYETDLPISCVTFVINNRKTVCNTIRKSRRIFRNESITFYKDGDYQSIRELPRSEARVCRRYGVECKFLGNDKKNSSTRIIESEL